MATQSLKEKTAKGLFWGSISNGIQQIISLIFGIFLARLLSRSDYGMVGMLSIFSLIASTLQESGFTAALVNKQNICHKDYNAVFWFSTLMGISIYIILFLCAPLIANFYNNQELIPLARYMFLGFVFSSLGTAQSAYMFRNLLVKQRSIATITALLLSGITGILLAYYGMAYWGIVTQSLIYVLINTCFFWYYTPWVPSLKIDFSPLKEMIPFSVRLLITNIFNNINHNILSIILGKFYSEKEVGDFNQANKWNFMGYAFINTMVSNVAQPVLVSVADDKERQKHIFRKMLRFTSFIAFPALFGLSFVAPELITIAITSKWIVSAELLRILCIGSAFTAFCGLYSNLIISKGKSSIYMWNTILLGIIQVGLMLYFHNYGIITMVKYYVCINIAWLLVWQYFVWREIGLTPLQALYDIAPFAIITSIVIGITSFITKDIENIYMLFLMKASIVATLYILFMWLSGSVTFRESIQYLLKRKV